MERVANCDISVKSNSNQTPNAHSARHNYKEESE